MLLRSGLFHSDLLTGHEPGRDAFHRVPILSGEVRNAVDCVPTLGKGRFMEGICGSAPLDGRTPGLPAGMHRVKPNP